MIDLPMPPSANAIWRKKRGGMYLSAEYQAWKRSCNQLCMMNRWHKQPVIGPYELTVTIDRAELRKGSDLGNREKPVSDFLQSAGIIENDNQAERIVLTWGLAPLGCRVTIEPSPSLPRREG